MRGRQRVFKGPGQQVKVDRNDQAAEDDAAGKIGRSKTEARQTGQDKQDPIAAGDKIKQSFLNAHTFLLPAEN